jgi:hypothetical protein
MELFTSEDNDHLRRITTPAAFRKSSAVAGAILWGLSGLVWRQQSVFSDRCLALGLLPFTGWAFQRFADYTV